MHVHNGCVDAELVTAERVCWEVWFSSDPWPSSRAPPRNITSVFFFLCSVKQRDWAAEAASRERRG